MKKVFAIIALMGVFTLGMTQSVFAQDEEAVDSAAVEQVDSAAVAEEEPAAEEVAEAPEPEVEEVGMYKQLKTKFIEGSAGWMFPVALALIIGLDYASNANNFHAFVGGNIDNTEKSNVVTIYFFLKNLVLLLLRLLIILCPSFQ